MIKRRKPSPGMTESHDEIDRAIGVLSNLNTETIEKYIAKKREKIKCDKEELESTLSLLEKLNENKSN